MLTHYTAITVLALMGFLTLSSTPNQIEPLAIDYQGVQSPASDLSMVFRPQDRSDEYTLIKGIITSKVKEGVWYQCGLKVPVSDWYDRAVEIAEACVYSARPYGLDPVGQLATWQQESRLDPCALGTYPRQWAVKHGLLKAKRSSLSYTKAEVERVLADPRFKASFRLVDLGLSQALYPAYTHGATVDELLSIDGALYSAKELVYRGIMWNTKEPWIYWPGYKSQEREDQIDWWVHRVMEIEFLHK